MPITHAELHDELIAEAKLLLDIAVKTLDHPPGDTVTDEQMKAYQDMYKSTPLEGVPPSGPAFEAMAEKGKARVTCG